MNLSYTPTDDVLVYATAAKGFRPGGPNTPVPLTGPAQCLTGPGNLQSLGLSSAPNQFNPDNVWSYEIGEKARALGNTLQINSALYYERWTDVQQLVDPSCGFSFTSNAGTASVYGLRDRACRESGLLFHGDPERGIHARDLQRHRPGQPAPSQGQRLLDVPDVTTNTSLDLLDSGVGWLEFQRPRHLHLCRPHAGHHLRAQ